MEKLSALNAENIEDYFGILSIMKPERIKKEFEDSLKPYNEKINQAEKEYKQAEFEYNRIADKKKILEDRKELKNLELENLALTFTKPFIFLKSIRIKRDLKKTDYKLDKLSKKEKEAFINYHSKEDDFNKSKKELRNQKSIIALLTVKLKEKGIIIESKPNLEKSTEDKGQKKLLGGLKEVRGGIPPDKQPKRLSTRFKQ